MMGDSRGADVDVGRPGQNRQLLSKVALCSTGPRKLTLNWFQLHARSCLCCTTLITSLHCVRGKIS